MPVPEHGRDVLVPQHRPQRHAARGCGRAFATRVRCSCVPEHLRLLDTAHARGGRQCQPRSFSRRWLSADLACLGVHGETAAVDPTNGSRSAVTAGPGSAMGVSSTVRSARSEVMATSAVLPAPGCSSARRTAGPAAVRRAGTRRSAAVDRHGRSGSLGRPAVRDWVKGA